MDPVYVTQTTIAVTILHKIHYSIEVLKKQKTKKRIIGFQNIIWFFIITLWVLLLLLLLLCATGNDVSHVTGSDVIFPRFFLTIVVVQNVPLLFIIRFTVSDYSFGIFWSLCCLSFDLRFQIIHLVSSSFPFKGTFCTTIIVRKRRGKITSLPVMGHFRSRDLRQFRLWRRFRSRDWRHFRLWRHFR
jgi:hypothetical protein